MKHETPCCRSPPGSWLWRLAQAASGRNQEGTGGCETAFRYCRRGRFSPNQEGVEGWRKLQLLDPPVAPVSAPAVPAHPSPYNFAGVQYPWIEADNRVTFQFKAPNAQKVQVSIVNVPFDMVKGSDGVWRYTSAPQAHKLEADHGRKGLSLDHVTIWRLAHR